MTATVTNRRYDVGSVKSAARGQWVGILTATCGTDPATLDGKAHGCPKCGGKDRFRLVDEAEGALFCNQCFNSNNGDGLAAIQWLNGCSFPDALRLVGDYLGLSPNAGDEAIKLPEPTTELADADFRNAVYEYVLSRCSLSMQHFCNMQDRGLNSDAIRANGYGTLHKSGRSKLARDALRTFGPDIVGVPGFYIGTDSQSGDQYLSLAGPVGMLIPTRNCSGRIIAINVRADVADSGNRYKWVSSKSKGGPGPGAPIHVPRGTPKNAPIYRVTEGQLKADIAFHRSGIPTISIPGVNNFKALPDTLKELGATTIRMALDSESGVKSEVALANRDITQLLRDNGFTVERETWPSEHKGIDDCLVAGVIPEIVTGDDVDRSITADLVATRIVQPDSADADDGRPAIIVDHEELETNDLSLKALSADETIFSRSGRLVRVCTNDTVAITDLQPATCRERLSAAAKFLRIVMVEGVEQTERIRVPGSVVNAILARGEYPKFRRLAGVAMCPAMAADGSLFSQTGYDPDTQIFVSFSGDVSVPDAPTKADIESAVATLLDVFEDFPFESRCHRVAVLAAIFTVVLRHQIDGPVPLFLVDANTRGSGKSLIAELVSLIALGMSASRMSQPEDDDECRKRITALAMCGAQMVLIDNISKPLGGASLDAVLTATTWTDRILGESRIVTFPWLAVLVATGNNVQLGADTSRRTVYIRLQSPLENPEERADFRHADIASFVRNNRSTLLAAVFTIARGFIQAGRPRHPGVAPWGSFEAWDRQIRHMLLWAGLADPGETRRELTRFADQGVSALSQLLGAWEQIDPDGNGIKSADIARKLSAAIPFDPITGEFEDPYQEFRDAMTELCPTANGKPPTSGQIAKRLAQYKGRVVDHRCIENRSAGKGLVSWHVSESAQIGAGNITHQDPIRVGQVGLGWADSNHLARERDITQPPEQKITAIGGSAKQSNPTQPTQPKTLEVASWSE